MTSKDLNPISNIAIPPGHFLEEILDEKNITLKELAVRLAKTPQAVSEIIKGIKEVTPEIALGLEKVFGVSAKFWLTLEARYQFVKVRLREGRQH